MRILGMQVERRSLLLLCGDALIGLIALAVAWSLRFQIPLFEVPLLELLRDATGAAALYLGTNLLTLYVAEAYEPALDFRRSRVLARLPGAVALALLAQMALFYAVPNWGMGRGVLVLSDGTFCLLLLVWRLTMAWTRPRLQPRVRTIILGADQVGHTMANTIRHHPEHNDAYELTGFIDDHHEVTDPIDQHSGLHILGGRDDLEGWVQRHRVGAVIVAIRSGMRPELTRQLLALKTRGVRIEDMRAVYKRITGKVPIHYVSDTSLIFGPEFAGSRGAGAALQRLADIGISLIGVALTWPVILVAGIAVKLETPGPAFYLQERVGQDEVPFTIIKLRTMGVDAEARSGAVWSQGAGDPRVTRVGRFLRRTRIDELPQFFNVLRGDMSMVGPRPERPHFVAQLKEQIPFYALRFAVKPGVTGWAQVRYRYGASVEDSAEKLCFDLYAIQEMSAPMYFTILMKTVQTVLLKPGS